MDAFEVNKNKYTKVLHVMLTRSKNYTKRTYSFPYPTFYDFNMIDLLMMLTIISETEYPEPLILNLIFHTLYSKLDLIIVTRKTTTPHHTTPYDYTSLNNEPD
jgi:hypothetical protein